MLVVQLHGKIIIFSDSYVCHIHNLFQENIRIETKLPNSIQEVSIHWWGPLKQCQWQLDPSTRILSKNPECQCRRLKDFGHRLGDFKIAHNPLFENPKSRHPLINRNSLKSTLRIEMLFYVALRVCGENSPSSLAKLFPFLILSRSLLVSERKINSIAHMRLIL